GVTATAVAGKILAGIGLEVSVDEALMVAIDGAHLAGPGIGDAKIAGSCILEHLAVGVDDFRRDAEEGPRGGARFQGGGAGKRRAQSPAGFRLPPGVADRAAAVAADAVIPPPGFRIDRLADRSQ